MYRDHYDGHGHYGGYSNGYSDGRRTTRRRLLPATPTGKRMSSDNPLTLNLRITFILLLPSVTEAMAH